MTRCGWSVPSGCHRDVVRDVVRACSISTTWDLAGNAGSDPRPAEQHMWGEPSALPARSQGASEAHSGLRSLGRGGCSLSGDSLRGRVGTGSGAPWLPQGS